MKPFNRILARVLGLLAVGAISWYLARPPGGPAQPPPPVSPTGPASPTSPARPAVPAGEPQAPAARRPADSGSAAAERAFAERAAGRQLLVAGRVQRILADDRNGSPHQRFIMATDRGQTLLVAHNLDLAPRLEGLAVGEEVIVFGEYEWNEQGGVMHWTHDDPRGVHVTGYIEWRGRRYE